MKLFAVVCVLLLGQLATAQFEDELGEIAPYEVIQIGDGYEERLYQPAKWVCHNTTGKTYTSRMKKRSIFALFRYITGSNEREEEIAMTAPVGVRMLLKPKKMIFFEMCFYLPANQQASPPLPTNPEVYIQNRPGAIVFARIFGGFATEDIIWEKEFQLLAKLLVDAGETNVDFLQLYSAGYDSPMKLKNRRNEVWYMKKN